MFPAPHHPTALQPGDRDGTMTPHTITYGGKKPTIAREREENVMTAKVKDAIKKILSTPEGERIMLPDFGSRISDILFKPVSLRQVADHIYESCNRLGEKVTRKQAKELARAYFPQGKKS